ncbi:hypothetical protein SAMN02745146_3051 [Hymenobacter daecheongensis DSM 21074]|uniref:Uncharacterized protein n=1 Tax=Hymenobacter daecheongensis DSM 21074 TaxID=1121955 RepID=A0A1M6J170_9BACT|nr:hypothetical protein [Hymenobacter daecheongensis]SHJ40392.1 hypothetical protein SAMN02745146_3051 [Hymenobacter daecheongensis DSM 21074]
MNTLITYDITIRHTEVKSAMKNKGYFDYWIANNQNYHLPNTSLWKKDTSQDTALADMQQVIQTLNYNQPLNNQIRLERCVAVPAYPWAAIPGDAHRKS